MQGFPCNLLVLLDACRRGQGCLSCCPGLLRPLCLEYANSQVDENQLRVRFAQRWEINKNTASMLDVLSLLDAPVYLNG